MAVVLPDLVRVSLRLPGDDITALMRTAAEADVDGPAVEGIAIPGSVDHFGNLRSHENIPHGGHSASGQCQCQGILSDT
jgi:hypothetical protein